MAQESLLNTNWNSGDEIAATELNTHGQEHLDLDGHADAFHSVQYVKTLAGGDGIDPRIIRDGDALSVAWSDASDLTSGGDIGAGVVTETELGVVPFTYDPGMTEWADGLSNEEVNRINLQSGEFLSIERVEFRQKGGGSSSQASVRVFDNGAATSFGSANLGSTSVGGISSQAVTVTVELTNSTGGTINAAPRVQGYITGV